MARNARATKTRPTSTPPDRRSGDWIRSTAQIRALTSPVRQEIIDALEAAGPCSVSLLATVIGRAPDGLYFHLRRLESCGVIRECSRTRGRQAGAVYDVVQRPVRLAYGSFPPSAITAVVAAAMRLGVRDFKSSIQGGASLSQGPTRELWGGRIKGWVTPKALRQINAALAECRTLMHSGMPTKNMKPMSLSFVMAPASLPSRVVKAAASPEPKVETERRTARARR